MDTNKAESPDLPSRYQLGDRVLVEAVVEAVAFDESSVAYSVRVEAIGGDDAKATVESIYVHPRRAYSSTSAPEVSVPTAEASHDSVCQHTPVWEPYTPVWEPYTPVWEPSFGDKVTVAGVMGVVVGIYPRGTLGPVPTSLYSRERLRYTVEMQDGTSVRGLCLAEMTPA